jgi:hypothetical protein
MSSQLPLPGPGHERPELINATLKESGREAASKAELYAALRGDDLPHRKLSDLVRPVLLRSRDPRSRRR